MKRTLAELKTFFETGDKPTQQEFYDWLDSFVHKDDSNPEDELARTIGVQLLNGNLSWGVKYLILNALEHTNNNSPVKMVLGQEEVLYEGNPITVKTAMVDIKTGIPHLQTVAPDKPRAVGQAGTIFPTDGYLYICIKTLNGLEVDEGGASNWVRIPIDVISLNQADWVNPDTGDYEENKLSTDERNALLAI